MHPRTRRLFRPILVGLFAAIAGLASGVPVRAESITYTFTGVGNGTVDSTAWSGTFTFVFDADTANIVGPSGGEYFQLNLGGTFSEGSYSATLLSDNFVVVNTATATPRLGFFNSTVDNGGTIQNSAFTTYTLATEIGPLTGTGSNVLPTFNSDGHGFGTTGGQTIELLGMTSLTFTATLQSVPEPSSVVLLASGLAAGLALLHRRRKARLVALSFPVANSRRGR
jgi:PEP-CTERM motif